MMLGRHRSLWFVVFLIAGAGLVRGGPAPRDLGRFVSPSASAAERTIFLAGGLNDEDTITFTSTLSACRHPGILLFDSPRSQEFTRSLLHDFRPSRVIPVDPSFKNEPDVTQRLGLPTASPLPWPGAGSGRIQAAFLPSANKLVVCPAEPRRLLLQAACLAGVLQAPLFVRHQHTDEGKRWRQCLAQWPITDVYAVGNERLPGHHAGLRIHRLAKEETVVAACARLSQQPIRTLVVANPADARDGQPAMSSLAPWIAVQKGALLLLTNESGTNVEEIVAGALRLSRARRAENLILVGNLRVLPMRRRPNPVPDSKDEYIEMEPCTPSGREPYSFNVGRLFHDDLNVVALMLARPRLWDRNRAPFAKALVVSNPGGSLPLLETFSRNTAREFKNAGYETRALFAGQASREQVRELLPQETIFLWEGHHSTLIRDYEVHEWTEPLRPSLVFLQSCLALTEEKALPFLRRGAVGVIGSSTRTFSGSGGALTLAYFNALLYEHQSLGASLRQAKNFLLAFALLKEKRLGEKSKLGGANLRTAWAFSLWGDPTLKLPQPARPEGALPRVESSVHKNTIHVSLPASFHEKTAVGRYQAEMWANARLGGLVRAGTDMNRRLVPLVFTEVSLPSAPKNKTPRLSSRLPGANWVFCWDARRRCGYLLAVPRTKDTDALRFTVHWD
jgi:hypothetical protein